MPHERRRPRNRRVTTRNESCGQGGNEQAEKPRLNTAALPDNGVVRKPNFYLGQTKPKEASIPDPSKIKEPKVGCLSLKPNKLKSLTDVFYQLACMID